MSCEHLKRGGDACSPAPLADLRSGSSSSLYSQTRGALLLSISAVLFAVPAANTDLWILCRGADLLSPPPFTVASSSPLLMMRFLTPPCPSVCPLLFLCVRLTPRVRLGSLLHTERTQGGCNVEKAGRPCWKKSCEDFRDVLTFSMKVEPMFG